MKKLNLAGLCAFIFLVGGCTAASKNYSSSPRGAAGTNNLQADLVWTSNLGEQQGFDIEESTDGVNFTQILVVPDGTNNATIIVPSSGKYYFRIRGYNQAGDSSYTQIVTASL